MAFWVDPKVKNGDNKQYDFIADKEADVNDLPTEEDKVEIGSSCLVITTANVYMLDSTRTWVALGGGE